MAKITQFGRALGRFRWWSLLAAVLVAIIVWRWFDGFLGQSPGPESTAGLAVDRSFPSPITGLVVNLGGFRCFDGTGPQIARTCSLELGYENAGGLADPGEEDCPADPAQFVVLVDRRGRHYGPSPTACPSSQPGWLQEIGQSLPSAADFRLPAEAVASRLLVAGQLVDLENRAQVLPALSLGETFSGEGGAISYRPTEFGCRALADGSRDEAYRWWRRLTNEANNDRYNPDRNLTTGKVFGRWQVCRLVVDYENTSPDTGLLWPDSCRAAIYRRARLIDDHGRQHEALNDSICQPDSIIWPPGSRTSETIEFAIDRLVRVERILVVDQLLSPK